MINIITRSRLEDRLETSAQLGQTKRLYAAKSLQLGQMTGVASLLSEQDRGYDYSFANGEKDGIKRRTVEIQTNLVTDSGIETALSFRRSDESYDVDDYNFGTGSYRTYLTDSASSGEKDETLAAFHLAINADDQKHGMKSGFSKPSLSMSITAPDAATATNRWSAISYGGHLPRNP